MFEPGLIVTRLVGPPGVSGPAATPAVASRLVTSGVPPGSICGQPGPGAIGHRRGEGPIAQVVQDAHLAGQLVGDDEIEPAAPVVSTAWTSETPRPTGRVTGGRKVGAASGFTGPTNLIMFHVVAK